MHCPVIAFAASHGTAADQAIASVHTPPTVHVASSTPNTSIAGFANLTHIPKVDRDLALTRLKPFEPRLRARGVRALYLFGSTARDEAHDESDLDLLFDYDPASRFSLFTQAELVAELSSEIGTKVDLIALDGLRPAFRARVTSDMVQVF